MKTIIKGKVLTHKLTLDDGIEIVTNAEGVDERKYVRRPAFDVETEREYRQIGEAIEDIGEIFIEDGIYNSSYIRLDNETKVRIRDKYYQHDVGANVILVDHVIEENTEHVAGTEDELVEHLLDYKFQYVEEDEELKTYVKVHNIDLEAVELDDLIKVVRGDRKTESVAAIYLSSTEYPEIGYTINECSPSTRA